MSEEFRKLLYRSSADQSLQYARFFRADESNGARPLAVALHTWSYDYMLKADEYLSCAQKYNWHLFYPDFRGPNWTPEACGSDLAVQDIADAVDYVRSHAQVDESRIYLIGGSGGGHMALLMAARHPELWSAVSAWCPIYDLGAWHKESAARNNNYAKHIELSCSGDPDTDPAAAEEALKRSSKKYLAGLRGREFIIDIATGIHDGHTGSVPVSHALHAFNALAQTEDQISKETIEYICQTEKIPEGMEYTQTDPGFGKYKVLFRRVSGSVRITLFEGGHTLLNSTGMAWLANQRRHAEPDWSLLLPNCIEGGELAK